MTTHKSIWQIARSVNELFFQNGLQQTNLLPRLPCETQPTIPNEAISPFLLRASVMLLIEVNRYFRDSWLQCVLGKPSPTFWGNISSNTGHCCYTPCLLILAPLLLPSIESQIVWPILNPKEDASQEVSLSCPLSEVKKKNRQENLA